MLTAQNAPKLFWLRHCGSWFAFDQDAQFIANRETGGYFADISGAQIFSVLQTGTKKPFEYRECTK